MVTIKSQFYKKYNQNMLYFKLYRPTWSYVFNRRISKIKAILELYGIKVEITDRLYISDKYYLTYDLSRRGDDYRIHDKKGRETLDELKTLKQVAKYLEVDHVDC